MAPRLADDGAVGDGPNPPPAAARPATTGDLHFKILLVLDENCSSPLGLNLHILAKGSYLHCLGSRLAGWPLPALGGTRQCKQPVALPPMIISDESLITCRLQA